MNDSDGLIAIFPVMIFMLNLWFGLRMFSPPYALPMRESNWRLNHAMATADAFFTVAPCGLIQTDFAGLFHPWQS